MFERSPQERYRIDYPTSDCFDPAEVPYPLSQQVQQTVGQLCLALAVGAGAQSAEADDGKLTNPFRPDRVPFNYTSSMFGTGIRASRFSEAEALVVIRKTFKEAGITLQQGQRIEQKGLTLRFDGLTADKKIGFKWLERHDKSFCLPNVNPPLSEKALGLSAEQRKAYRDVFDRAVTAAGTAKALPRIYSVRWRSVSSSNASPRASRCTP